jgi:hypothetical protein
LTLVFGKEVVMSRFDLIDAQWKLINRLLFRQGRDMAERYGRWQSVSAASDAGRATARLIESFARF